MYIFEEIIKPYTGIGIITFSMTYDETKDYLKANSIKYTVDLWENKGCDPEVAWNIIRIDNCISLFFAKGKMFKICLENRFNGLLDNGICIGMPIKKAMEIDPTLKFIEDEEYYSSELGYWLEDDVDSQCITSITIFIKALLDEDQFFTYEWV